MAFLMLVLKWKKWLVVHHKLMPLSYSLSLQTPTMKDYMKHVAELDLIYSGDVENELGSIEKIDDASSGKNERQNNESSSLKASNCPSVASVQDYTLFKKPLDVPGKTSTPLPKPAIANINRAAENAESTNSLNDAFMIPSKSTLESGTKLLDFFCKQNSLHEKTVPFSGKKLVNLFPWLFFDLAEWIAIWKGCDHYSINCQLIWGWLRLVVSRLLASHPFYLSNQTDRISIITVSVFDYKARYSWFRKTRKEEGETRWTRWSRWWSHYHKPRNFNVHNILW